MQKEEERPIYITMLMNISPC